MPVLGGDCRAADLLIAIYGRTSAWPVPALTFTHLHLSGLGTLLPVNLTDLLLILRPLPV